MEKGSGNMSVEIKVSLEHIPDGLDGIRLTYNGNDERLYHHVAPAKIFIAEQIRRDMKKIDKQNGGRME